jgi:hypothetical protein
MNGCACYAEVHEETTMIQFCPTHARAEILRAALADVLEVMRLQAPDLYDAMDDARALLAATQKGA